MKKVGDGVYVQTPQERAKKNLRKIWGKTYVRHYWPNFYRWEQDDEDWGSYHIYINKEEVEWLPMRATEEDAIERFHYWLDQYGIESDEMYEWKERN